MSISCNGINCPKRFNPKKAKKGALLEQIWEKTWEIHL